MSCLQRNARNQVIPQTDGICPIGETVTLSSKEGIIHQMNDSENSSDKAFKSELNVVLLPNPMPLITFDKYKNIQRWVFSKRINHFLNLLFYKSLFPNQNPLGEDSVYKNCK